MVLVVLVVVVIVVGWAGEVLVAAVVGDGRVEVMVEVLVLVEFACGCGLATWFGFTWWFFTVSAADVVGSGRATAWSDVRVPWVA